MRSISLRTCLLLVAVFAIWLAVIVPAWRGQEYYYVNLHLNASDEKAAIAKLLDKLTLDRAMADPAVGSLPKPRRLAGPIDLKPHLSIRTIPKAKLMSIDITGLPDSSAGVEAATIAEAIADVAAPDAVRVGKASLGMSARHDLRHFGWGLAATFAAGITGLLILRKIWWPLLARRASCPTCGSRVRSPIPGPA